jgi:PAS domain-containing protein
LNKKNKSTRKPLPIDVNDISSLTPDEIRDLIQDLQIHKIELKVQAEEFKATQEELSQSLDKYQKLYDTIPVGHCTIDKNYTILEANAAAAKMLKSGSIREAPISRKGC